MKVIHPSSFSLQALQAFKCLRVEVMLDSRAMPFWLLGSFILKVNFGILKHYRRKSSQSLWIVQKSGNTLERQLACQIYNNN